MHAYDKHGNPVYQVEGANGKLRDTRVADMVVVNTEYVKNKRSGEVVKYLKGQKVGQCKILGWDKLKTCILECECKQIFQRRMGTIETVVTCGCQHHSGLSNKKYIGKKFNRLTVLSAKKRKNKSGTLWKCACECGKIKTVDASCVFRGSVRSCGCLHKELCSAFDGNKTHGMSKTRTYGIWSGMLSRTTNKNDIAYKKYGAIGRGVCDEWRSFESFYRDMGTAPKGKTLERINNKLGYFKENCKWATYKEQNNNRSDNVFYTFNGERKTLSQWSDCCEISRATIRRRLKLGWDFSRAISEKPNSYIKLYEINGEKKKASEWAKIIGISRKSFAYRIKSGWDENELLKPNKHARI